MISRPPRRIAVLMVSARPDGGAEALLRTLVDELVDEPVEFEVFTLREVRADRAADLDARGIRHHAFPARRLIDPIRFVRLLRAIGRGRYDVIHTNLPAANILGMLGGLVLRVPVVATLHNVETKADRHWYQGRLETAMLRMLAARVIAVGDRTAAARRARLPGTEIHVLHNAVAATPPLESGERDRLRREIMSDPTRSLLLAVGRLTDQKAHDLVIDAFEGVRRRRPDVELAIAGRGAHQTDLERQIEHLQLSDVVHLLGVRRDIRRVMRAADLFVMGSRWEGLPVALLEAMEAGLPVVATDVGDVAEVVDGAVALLVPPERRDALATAMCQMLDDTSARASTTNPQVVEQRYSSSAWATDMVEHYDAAMAGGPALSRRRRRSPRRS